MEISKELCLLVLSPETEGSLEDFRKTIKSTKPAFGRSTDFIKYRHGSHKVRKFHILDEEILIELDKHKIYICKLSETKIQTKPKSTSTAIIRGEADYFFLFLGCLFG